VSKDFDTPKGVTEGLFEMFDIIAQEVYDTGSYQTVTIAMGRLCALSFLLLLERLTIT
jgi:hypothetical protein